VRLREPIQLNESVEAVVTLLMGEDTDALATQEAVDMAASKVFEKVGNFYCVVKILSSCEGG
jgi:hypothetical protein